ncbi:DsbA family protein [Patescibacteria group bacterium]
MPKNTISSYKWPQVILVVLLIVSSFMLGSLYTKVQYLEGTGGKQAQAPSNENENKFNSLNDAMSDIAKKVKIDDKKLLSCLSSASKAEIVNNDVAIARDLGASGTPAYFINGRFLGGAFPPDIFKEIIDKELDGTATDDASTYSEFLQNAYNSERKSFNPVAKKIDIRDSSIRGESDAKVVIVEFSDFQCPFCKRGKATINQIADEYKKDVKVVFKHLPLVAIHPHAQKTAEAAECAKDQGKFWEFHDQLFETQEVWSSI